MTGAVQAAAGAAAAASEYLYSVAVTEFLSDVYGANTSGSFTPSSFRGATILSASSRPVSAGSPYDFQFVIDDNLGFEPGQAWFRGLRVRDSAGNWRYFSSASAQYTGGILSGWSWGDGTDLVWTSAGTYPFFLVL